MFAFEETCKTNTSDAWVDLRYFFQTLQQSGTNIVESTEYVPYCVGYVTGERTDNRNSCAAGSLAQVAICPCATFE